jgi:hypothetical protein
LIACAPALARGTDCADELRRARELAQVLRTAPTPGASPAASPEATPKATHEATLDELRAMLAPLAAAAAESAAKSCAEAYVTCALALGQYDAKAPGDVRVQALLRAVELAEAHQLLDPLARAANRAADLLSGQGKLREARSVLRRALAQPLDAATLRPFLCLSLANVEGLLLEYGRAFELLDEAASSLPRQKSPAALEARLQLVRSQIVLNLGLLDRASTHLEAMIAAHEARAASGAPSTLEDRRNTALQRIQLALAQDNHERVARETQAALADSDLFPIGSPHRAAILARRASTLAQAEDRGQRSAEKAADLLREAVATEHLPAQLLASLLVRLGNRESENAPRAEVDALLDRAHAALSAGDADDPRQLRSEWSALAVERARLALRWKDGPQELREHAGRLRARLERWLELWRSIPPRQEGLGLLQSSDARALPSELIRLELALDTDEVDAHELGAERALEVVLALQSQHALMRRLGLPSASFAELRTALTGEHRGVLAYFPGPVRGHVIAFDGTTILARELRSYDALQTLRAALTLADDSKRASAESALAAALLPEDVLSRVRAWRAVTISGIDLLAEVAFEALPLPGGSRLGLTHAITYTPSLPLSRWLTERAPHAAGEVDAVLIACPTPAASAAARWPNLERLEWRADVEQTLERWPKGRTRIAKLEDASFATLREFSALRPRVLQFLGHGVHLPGESRPAHLLLAPSAEGDSGLLSCDDVEALEAPELIVLASCRSGRGPSRRGDESAQHFGGAWIAAGARCVILSPNDLSFEPVVRASGVLQQRLAAGDAPDEALRRARVELEAAGFPAREWSSLHALGAGAVPLVRSAR